MYWDIENIPHKGWKCVNAIDLLDGCDEFSLEEKNDLYESCEMCKKGKIRYVHIMEHNEYERKIRVGCSCAEKLEEDYANPTKREKNLRNKMSRKRNFMKKEWSKNNKENYVLKYKQIDITISPDKYKKDKYNIFVLGNKIYEHKGKPITTFLDAKAISFNIVDEHINNY